MMTKLTLTIDDRAVEAEEGASVLEVALENDIYVPHLCYYPGVEPWGACRLCLVETGNLGTVPACRTPVEAGMTVTTKNPGVLRAVRRVAEMLVANHHASCGGCPSNRKCQLQQVMRHLRIDRRRMRRLRPPESVLPLENFGDCFDYDANRCVLCGICVQTCEDIQGTSCLYFTNRGTETRVAFWGDEAKCLSCMACVERCPVGVLMPRQAAPATD